MAQVEVKVNNRVSLTKLDAIDAFISSKNKALMREEYHLIEFLFKLKSFPIHGLALKWLLTHAEVITSGKKKIEKLQFKFGPRRMATFEPEHMALITGLNFGHLPDIESDMKTPFLSLFNSENLENMVFQDVLELLHKYSMIDKDSEIVRKLVVLYIIYKIVFSMEPKSYINYRLVIISDDPAQFNAFPLGKENI